MSMLGSWTLEPAEARRQCRAPFLTVLVTLLFSRLASIVHALSCPSAPSEVLALGIDIVHDLSCATGAVVGCLSASCRYCQAFSTGHSQQYQLCSLPIDRALGAVNATANRCPLSVSLGDAAMGLNLLTDESCASGGLGCILTNCRFCKVLENPVTSPYLNCSELVKTPDPTPVPVPNLQPHTGELPDTPRTNFCSAKLIDLAKLNAGVWAFVDEDGCHVNPSVCTLRVCKYCRYADSSASLGFMPCPREGSDEQWLLSPTL